MKPREAIEIIKRMNKGDPTPEQKEALEIAYAATEKQIGKKVETRKFKCDGKDEPIEGRMLTGWIPVDERLPAPNERVLMYRPCMEDAETGPVSVQWGWAYKDASYWMPVPNAPEN